MGCDFAVATFPRFQCLDDMELFVDRVMPHFSQVFWQTERS